jgi:hypothetical protein
MASRQRVPIWFSALVVSWFISMAMAPSSKAQTIDFSLSSYGTGYASVGPPTTEPGEYSVTTNPSAFTGNGYVSYIAPGGSGDMMLVDGAYATNVWSETVSGTADAAYTFTVDVADPDPAPEAFGCCNPALLGLFINGTQVGSSVSVGETPGVWTEWTQTFTAPSASIPLSIEDLNTTPGTAGDDFTLAPVPAAVTPEPTSMLLFGTGLLGIALVMRKRLFA